MAEGRSDTSGRLGPLSRDLHRLIARCAEPAWTAEEAERRIAEGERVAAAIRAVFRGGAAPAADAAPSTAWGMR